MATRKAGGTARNLRDSNPKYLGVKVTDGQMVNAGSIIIRQRGTDFMPGKNTDMGKDHTIHALITGKVSFGTARKVGFDNRTVSKKVVRVLDVK